MLPMRSMGFFKRLALMLLVVLVDMVYKTDIARAWSSYSQTTGVCNVSSCGTGFATVVRGDWLFASSKYVANAVNTYTQCYCFTSAEWASISACAAKMCSTTINAYTLGKRSWTLGSTTSSLGACTGTHVCYCSAGYGRATGSIVSCTLCSAGYYCNDTTYFYEGGGVRKACSIGYYCSTTGLTSQTKCPAGSYTSTTAQIKCIACAAGYYCPGGTSVVCPIGSYCPVSSMSAPSSCLKGYYCPSIGMTAALKCPSNPPATTAGTGSKYATQCYYPANTDASDDYGTYQFTSACYYAS